MEPTAQRSRKVAPAFPPGVLRESGHFGPRVDVPPDADTQTRLIAFTGRHP